MQQSYVNGRSTDGGCEMKIMIGCDVDPVLPARLATPPGGDVWEPLGHIPALISEMGEELPPVTWLIRSDASVHFATGDYASGYLARRDLWSKLAHRGDELGWHMHLLSFSEEQGAFVFDPEPVWLTDAFDALARHIPVRATRTGWDFANNFLFARLDDLGIELDFSALPGNRVWSAVGGSPFIVDWLGSPDRPYHPSTDDYRRPGGEELRMLEVPIAQFPNSTSGVLKRLAWRLRNGCLSFSGLRNKTRMLTDPWQELPHSAGEVWAFYFHPEDLTDEGIRNFVRNVERLRGLPDAEFFTAGAMLHWYGVTGPRGGER